MSLQRFTTNYRGPLRKGDLVRQDDNMQFFATALTDVCYRLYAEIRGTQARGSNPKHHLEDLFNRRLHRQGRCYRTPCLGWSEFTCRYWGPFREGVTEVDDALTLDVPSMLVGVWDHPVGGGYAPGFVQDVWVERGVLVFPSAPVPEGVTSAQ